MWLLNLSTRSLACSQVGLLYLPGQFNKSWRNKWTVQPLQLRLQVRSHSAQKHPLVRCLSLFCMITCHATAKITQCRAGGSHYVSLWNNTQHLFSSCWQGLWTGPAQNKRAAGMKGGRQTQVVYSHWLASSTFACAHCRQCAVPFHFIRADKWHSATGR